MIVALWFFVCILIAAVTWLMYDRDQVHERLSLVEGAVAEMATRGQNTQPSRGYITMIGPAGPLDIPIDDDLASDLEDLRKVRRDIFRLAVQSEIADKRVQLEMPREPVKDKPE